jgi:rare lipoprotein A (peptidoglycan hydrolase)
MKRLSATTAALTAAVLAASVTLPAAASTGTSNGGASASPPPADNGSASAQSSQSSSSQSAQAAAYKPVRATWYGPGLYGHRMACGAKLTRNTLGVAHRRLPCGTQVALRYRGRTVVVPVIDRGPYSRGVDYDLTAATARQLGMTQTSRVGAAPLDQ